MDLENDTKVFLLKSASETDYYQHKTVKQHVWKDNIGKEADYLQYMKQLSKTVRIILINKYLARIFPSFIDNLYEPLE